MTLEFRPGKKKKRSSSFSHKKTKIIASLKRDLALLEQTTILPPTHPLTHPGFDAPRCAALTPPPPRTRTHASLTSVVKRSSAPPCRRSAHLQCAVCVGVRGQALRAGQTLLPRRQRGAILPTETSKLPRARLCLFFFLFSFFLSFSLSHPGCASARGRGIERDSVTMARSCLTEGRRFVHLPFFLLDVPLKSNSGRS